MSNALGVASVSMVLVDLLNNGVVDHDVATSVGAVTVSALPPDRIDTTDPSQPSRLNLFLYQLTPNPAWRNVGLPARNAAGERTENHPLALDLHYLLTAYGSNDFHSEILIGHGMQILHETPVLDRQSIRRALAPPTQVPEGVGLPAELRALATSQLAEQVELIKITPEILSTEEISKLWSAFQTHYRPTAAYVATVVVIESDQATRGALPVAYRTVRAKPMETPVIERLLSIAAGETEARAGQPILPDSALIIEGRGLRGDQTEVLVGGVDATPADTDILPQRIQLAIPGGLRAGIRSVQVRHGVLLGSPPIDHQGAESNLEAFVLRPRIDAIQILDPTIAEDGSRTADVRLTVTPEVDADQTVVLLMNELDPGDAGGARSYRFTRPPEPLVQSPPLSPPAASNQVTVPISSVQPGDYLFRVQVDGAESQLDLDAQGRFSGPQETIA